jgi:hypothetical protein
MSLDQVSMKAAIIQADKWSGLLEYVLDNSDRSLEAIQSYFSGFRSGFQRPYVSAIGAK